MFLVFFKYIVSTEGLLPIAGVGGQRQHLMQGLYLLMLLFANSNILRTMI